ncbi:MAG: Nucleotidyltransferase domain protein [Candidatus Methanoperedenaceae archaeon GB37]|nr:Nucleotidyltransferase domain protein [Candidatus Methanoperedenaceae archaeon GB37]CAD7783256.1 MAG: Nucleotidyltransferase domain protein [Candidatus Methanoperedenaceae archaeon GB37]
MSHQAEIIKKIREHYPFLSKEFGVKRIGIFGSVARHEEGPGSDIDIVVEFNKPIGLKFIGFVEHIESLLGEKSMCLRKKVLRIFA